MTDFNPDAYLDEQIKGTAPAFDPDAYLNDPQAGKDSAPKYMPDGSKYTGAPWQDALLKSRQISGTDTFLGSALAVPIMGIGSSVAKAGAGLRGLYDVATGQGVNKATTDINRIVAEHQPYQVSPNASASGALGAEFMQSPANPINWPGKAAEVAGTGLAAGARALGAGPELSQGIEQGVAEAGPWALGLAAPKGGAAFPEAAPGEFGDFEPPTKAHGPSVSDQILADSRKAGYVVPPATTNPNILNRAMEGFAGKASVAQLAAIKNQPITDNLARSALNLPQDAELTPETMEQVRAPAGEVYGQVAGAGRFQVDDQYKTDLSKLSETANVIKSDLPNYRSGAQSEVQDLSTSLVPENGSMDANTAVALSKDLRKNANANFSLAARTGDSTRLDIARAQQAAAAAVEDQLSRHLESMGLGDLSARWDEARRTIAKSYSVQNALDGAGHVDATKLGKQLIKGKPLSGELETAANFANAFPKAARVLPGKESMPGMSPLDVYGSVATSVATHNPLPLLIGPGRMVARGAALSKAMQPKATKP
jgi:hypothetical protein